MLMFILKVLFALMALITTTMMVYGKLFVFKKRKPQFVSDYCATMAVFLIGYVISSLVLVWFFPLTHQKLIMFGFAISPFLIGLLATYNTEKYYTALQVLIFLVSTAYVLL